jgi:hypothetical protein
MPVPATIITRVLADPVRMYLPSDYWNRARDFFSFNLDMQLNAAAGQVQDTFTVQNDSDFLCLCINITAATAAAGTAERGYMPYLISIADSGSGAQWFGGDGNGFTHVQNIANVLNSGTKTAADYSPLEHPRFIPAASTVTVVLNNLSAVADRVWLSFRGVKIYRSLRQGN